jgi:hypothetical protein
VIENNTLAPDELYADGGISAFGYNVVISSSIVAGNGGNTFTFLSDGISVVRGNLEMTDCFLSNNRGQLTSEIYVGEGSQLTIANSTISDRIAGPPLGRVAIYCAAPPSHPQIPVPDVEVRIVNSTISGGFIGVELHGQTATIRDSTIVTSQIAVQLYDGDLLLDHAIVAGNTVVAGPEIRALSGAVVGARNSLVSKYFDSGLIEAPVGSPDVNGNLIGGEVHGVIDPLLGPLADNGGFTL